MRRNLFIILAAIAFNVFYIIIFFTLFVENGKKQKESHALSRSVLIDKLNSGDSINGNNTNGSQKYDNSKSNFNFNYHDSLHIESIDKETSSQSTLTSYTYSNCPFTITKFSQYHLAKKGPFPSEEDKRLNSIQRAKMALNLSNKAKSYERVLNAIEIGAFDDRKIILDGDSLTRQLFISIGCLAWTAGKYYHSHVSHCTLFMFQIVCRICYRL